SAGIAGTELSVIDCNVTLNSHGGIRVNSESIVKGNNCDSNRSVGDGAGIHVTGFGSRIEANNLTDNTWGIRVDASGNVIIRNTASGNGMEFAPIEVGNDLGPIGSASTATSPFANITF
ncbi:MAG: hypothetical protein AAF492_31720, partial [Verrucomicrobiota bacterium]